MNESVSKYKKIFEIVEVLNKNNERLKLSEPQIYGVAELISGEFKGDAIELPKEPELINRKKLREELERFVNESDFMDWIMEYKLIPKKIIYRCFIEYLEKSNFKTNIGSRSFYKDMDSLVKGAGIETKYFNISRLDFREYFSKFDFAEPQTKGNNYSCYAITGADKIFNEYSY